MTHDTERKKSVGSRTMSMEGAVSTDACEWTGACVTLVMLAVRLAVRLAMGLLGKGGKQEDIDDKVRIGATVKRCRNVEIRDAREHWRTPMSLINFKSEVCNFAISHRQRIRLHV